MKSNSRTNEINSSYIKEHEKKANKYVMRCFSVTMIIYTIAFLLNIIGVFIIDKEIMLSGYIPFLIIFAAIAAVSLKADLSNPKIKYILFTAMVIAFTILGSTITYHVALVSLLPFMCATLYPSKKFMKYVYVLAVISTFITVYGGYYWGLCDANMVLLTAGKTQDYVINSEFILTQVNENPMISLLLYFVLPRCLIFIAFASVCNSIYTILSDSVEKARLTSELEKAKNEAESANKAKSRFIARISHEIRTPINAIMGINEMIIQETNEPETMRCASDIKDSSYVMLSIVNDILDSAKIESGKMEIVPVNYSLKSLLNDVYNMTGIKAREKKLDLIFDVDPSIPCEYFGDDKRIRQILLNLLSNSVKYTEKGTVTLSVGYHTENDTAVLSFSVKDTGIGIKEEDIGKLYDEFQRIDVSRNRNIEGTGLGMPIVQTLLKLMDSELKIRSEYEKGSEFSFELKQKIINNTPMGDFKSSKTEGKKSARIEFTAPDAKILVVDDNLMNLKVFSGLLKNTQLQITEANSGFKCLELVKENDFDMIFLDHMMPEMDGIETMHKLREEKLCEGTPIIMLTANTISGDRERYLNEGFDDFLSKPIIPEKLDKMIIYYLENKGSQKLSEAEAAENEAEAVLEGSDNLIEIIRRRLPEIDVDKGLKTCIEDEDFYIELFTDFSKLKIKDELIKFLGENDFNNYCIRIHGFKNNAYSVGAVKLGDLSYEMEKMSREGLPEEIKAMQNSLFEQYDRICSCFNEITKGHKK